MVKFLNLAKGFYNFPLCGEKIINIKNRCYEARKSVKAQLSRGAGAVVNGVINPAYINS